MNERFFSGLLALGLTIGATYAQQAQMTSVFQDNKYQFTGITVSKTGRMFVNYPYWTDIYQYALVEINKDGSRKPYPDANWNSWRPGQDPSNKWVCVQSPYVDDKDRLWVIDPASPKQSGVYKNGHKLVCFDLKTNKVEKIYPMAGVVGSASYLNDVRVDTKREVAYITESQNGGIVVLDIKSGKARLVLQNHPSVKADPAFRFIIDGRELKDDKGPVRFNSDGLALTPDGDWLYYKPLSDNKLYRIKTEFLRDENVSDKGLGAKVEDLGKWTTTDGMAMDSDGNLYLGDIINYTIYRITNTSGAKAALKRENIITDKVQLQWPDSYAIQNGFLYITTSQIDHMAKNNKNRSTRTRPYEVFKIKVD